MPDNKPARPYPKIQPRCLRIILFSALFSQPEGFYRFYQCRKMLSTITSTTPTAHAMVEVMDQKIGLEDMI